MFRRRPHPRARQPDPLQNLRGDGKNNRQTGNRRGSGEQRVASARGFVRSTMSNSASRPTIVGRGDFASLRAERSNPALNASRPWIASSLPLLAMTTNVLVLAMRFAPELLFKKHEFFRSPHRSSPEHTGGGCRYPHDPCFRQFQERTEESKEAERRETRSQPPHPAGCGARRALRARLSASHHGSCQRDVGPKGSASGQASWDVVSPGITRRRLSQSSGSTPRTGRNAGEHDARSRPGTAVTNRRPREPTLAPPCGVTA